MTRSRLFASIGYALFLLAVAEGFLWIATLASGDFELALSNRYGVAPYLPDSILGLRPNPRYGDHDEWGHRNERVPSTVEIVALGDSQTYGVCAPRSGAWPQQLAHMTGRSVYNMACGQWAPPHYLVLLPRAMKLQPKVVLTAFYAGNDLWDSLFVVHHLKSVPEFMSEPLAHPEVTKQVDELVPAIEEASRREEEFLQTSGSRADATAPSAPGERGVIARYLRVLRQRSKLWGLARLLRARTLPGSSSQDEVIDESHWGDLVERARSDDSRVVFQAAKVGTILSIDYRLKGFELAEEGLRLALDALRRAHESLQARGVRHLVVLIPTKERVYYPFCPPHDRQRPAYEALVTEEDEVWADTIALLQREQIAYVDTRPCLQAAIAEGVTAYPSSAQSHPNSKGYEHIARCVAEALRTMLTSLGSHDPVSLPGS